MTYHPSDLDQSAWAFNPWLEANAVMLALMSLSLLIQFIQFAIYRRFAWGFSVFVITGLFLEVLGYAGRVWAHNNVIDMNPFMLQICCLTMAPVFLTGGIYLTLGRIVRVSSVALSYLPPVAYTYIFFSSDIISVALQGAGGALTSIGAQKDDDPQKKMMMNGIYITRAGLVFQVFSLVVFMGLTGIFYFRCFRNRDMMDKTYAGLRNSRRFRLMLWALVVATLTIFVRCVYRIYELSGKWGSPQMSDQTAFLILEGIMIVISVFALNVGHPGMGFKGSENVDDATEKGDKAVDVDNA